MVIKDINDLFETIEISDWNDVKTTLGDLCYSPTGLWVFRGQSNSKWLPEPSIIRAGKIAALDAFERNIFIDFQRKAHNYIQHTHLAEEEDTLGWFALMQHHGAPTRLLDCTKSPYVASYFAFENAEDKNGKCAVWAFNIKWLMNQGLEKIKTIPKYSTLTNLTDTNKFGRYEFFADIFFQNKIDLVFPAEPYYMSERLTIQQGLFLCINTLIGGFLANLM